MWPGNKYRGRGNDGRHAMCGKPVEAAMMEKSDFASGTGIFEVHSFKFLDVCFLDFEVRKAKGINLINFVVMAVILNFG